MRIYIPKQGDIVWIHFDLQKGREMQKTRPALTISPLSYNQKTGLGLFMPITSKIKKYPFEIPINQGKIQGAILSDQIRSFDWRARKVKFIIHLPSSVLENVIAKLALLLLKR